ncbi:hypothetical protein EYV94_22250 [Puteibacter caeruleilacunae]|nr:hypothetical protein EYV94_22250 [Puteibacter caeruleilacunae]
MVVTEDGHVLLYGTERESPTESKKLALYKLDSIFNIDWHKNYGGVLQDEAAKIKIARNGDILLAATIWDGGSPRESMSIIRCSPEGEVKKQAQYGGYHAELALGICETSWNNLIICGFSKSEEKNGNCYVVSANADTKKQWEQHWGSKWVDYAFDITQSHDDNLLIYGSQGGFHLSTREDFHSHDADLLLIKCDKLGNKIWQKTYGEKGHDQAVKILKDHSDGYYLLGSTQSYGEGSFDILLMHINDSGEKSWHNTFGSNKLDQAADFMLHDKSLYLLGITTNKEKVRQTYWVKTDLDGQRLFENSTSSTIHEKAIAIDMLPNGNIITCSYSISSNNKTTIILRRFNQKGELLKKITLN